MTEPATGTSTVPEVGADATVVGALAAVAATGIAVVRDGDGRLLGTVTDRELRVAVLDGAALATPVRDLLSVAPTWATPDDGDDVVAGMMAAGHLEVVPVVDGDEVVGARRAADVGLHRPGTTAVILAGGRGSRLAPLTDKVPKPLLSVGGRTIIGRILENLGRAGITDVHLAVNYLAEVFEDRLGDGSASGVRLTYLHEQEPLDTAGALSLLPTVPPGPVLVMNADQISSLPFDRLVEHHRASGVAITVASFEHAVEVPYGVLRLDRSAVTAIEEKPTVRMPCNAGIYVLEPEVLELVPASTPYQMPSLISAVMARGMAVGAFPIIERFIDIGTRQELDRALLWFATGEEE